MPTRNRARTAQPRLARTAAITTALTAAVAAALALSGCAASKPATAYTPATEATRNSPEADRLNQQAVDLIATDPRQAEDLLRRALAADLYHGPAHNNLGTLLLKRGQLYDAAGEFEWAKKLMPGHPDPRMNLGLTLELAGRTDDALASYRTALEVYPDHLATMQALTRLQLRSGRADDTTRRMLGEIAMRGDTERWRDWARIEGVKAESVK